MPGLIRHLPQHRPWMITLISIAAVVVLATCGLGSYLLMHDDSQVVGGNPTASPTVPKRDISDRKLDPKFLTVADVFPSPTIVADPSIPPYKRIGDPQFAKDCRLGAAADLGKLLVSLGCSQLVRATFSSPDGAFLVTAGVFNLQSNASALGAQDRLKQLVNTAKGRFTGYITDSSTKILGMAPTQSAWAIQGHFLIYCVIARIDGKDVPSTDQHIAVMVYDIVQKYLRDKVIADWSIDRRSPGGAAAAASASPTG
jgi:hypothetical protein